MLYRKAAVFLIIQIHVLQAISHAIDTQDTKIFEIAVDDANYNEESENEMIQPKDVADFKSLIEDKDRYRPLHSHVKYYNERNSENTKPYSNMFLYLQSHMKEIFNLEQENKPFIAGFKNNLDKYFSKTIRQSTDVRPVKITKHINFEKNKKDKNKKSIRLRREKTTNYYKTATNKKIDFFQTIRKRNVTTDEINTEAIKNILEQSSISERSTLANNESSYEESYDYKRFKMEYEQQLEDDIKKGKVLNYTEKEEQKKGALKLTFKKIMDLKRPRNCTKEEISQIGIKAIECLLYDYQHAKDVTTVKIVLSKTWLVFRVWLLIYICLAIPCWCQRGWCCCCLRCKFCFPRKRIMFVKQYYAKNPPGVFVKDLKKEKSVKEPVKYEATEYEYIAYENFETAIRNI